MAAANTTQGAGAWVALGEETTEGTSVTPDIFAAFRTETLKLVAPREGVEPNGMPGGAIPTQRDTFVKEERVEGDLVTTARFDDQLTLILLKHLFGSVTTGGAGPYTYTYTPTRAVPTKPSITVELVRGTGGSGIDRAETFAGCRVARLQLKVTTGGVVECTWGLLGISSEGLAAPTSATFETGRTVILHNHATNFSFNGSQMEEIEDLTLTIDHALSPTMALGRKTSGPMHMSGLLGVSLALTHRYTENAQVNAYQAKTQGVGSLTFTDGTASAVFSFAKMEIESHSHHVGGPGLVKGSTNLVGLSTASNAGVGLVVTNSVAP